ncbi:MAG TPA: hypothetical protein VFW11_18835 [Cyclobacteriaceae bacterium]|nr:hypothetical protein [Cyclobacteriaceae bacterium]
MSKTGIPFVIFFISGIITSAAQGFITPVEEVPHANECYIIKTDGTRMEGKVKSYDIGEGIKAITIENSNGEKLKVPAMHIREFGVKSTGLVKMELMAESTETIRKFTKADFNEIAKREYIVYQQALMPGKKDKYALLQLLNPDFDSRIKVFQDPFAVETNGLNSEIVSITGQEDKSYLFVKDNNRAFKVKKGSYKKDFDDIFGDCIKMAEAYGGEKLKFRNAAEHVWVYDRACSTDN